MSTKETLMKRPDIPDEYVEELVERAAILQDRDQPESNHATPEDIVRVAEELDIDPQYVEQAITEWQEARVDASSHENRQRIQGRGRKMMRVFLIGLTAVTVLGIAAAVSGVVMFGWAGLAGVGGAVAAIVAFIGWLIS